MPETATTTQGLAEVHEILTELAGVEADAENHIAEVESEVSNASSNLDDLGDEISLSHDIREGYGGTLTIEVESTLDASDVERDLEAAGVAASSLHETLTQGRSLLDRLREVIGGVVEVAGPGDETLVEALRAKGYIVAPPGTKAAFAEFDRKPEVRKGIAINTRYGWMPGESEETGPELRCDVNCDGVWVIARLTGRHLGRFLREHELVDVGYLDEQWVEVEEDGDLGWRLTRLLPEGEVEADLKAELEELETADRAPEYEKDAVGVSVKSIADLYRTRINGITLGEIELPQGASDGIGSRRLCIMQMFNVAVHGDVTMRDEVSDGPPGSCETLRAYCIQLNDHLGDGPRQRLKEYTVRLITAPVSDDLAAKRREVLDGRNTFTAGFWEEVRANPLIGFRILDELLAVK